MPIFKPMTSRSREGLLKTTTSSEPAAPIFKPETKTSIVDTTTERIGIIYDDSGSMGSYVYEHDSKSGHNTSLGTRQELACAATTDYMKNCAPHVTAVEIRPLNENTLALTKNLPALAKKIEAIQPSGGTPLFGAVAKLVSDNPLIKYTRALIFTDGEAQDYDPQALADAKALEIPIDLIIIGDVKRGDLALSMQKLASFVESTGGTFLICKDGKAFKEKMKYFAPLLRYMLPSIASQES